MTDLFPHPEAWAELRARDPAIDFVVEPVDATCIPEALGRGLLAFISVQVDDRLTEGTTGAQLALLPQVQEVHHIAGEDCYLLKVRCASTGDLGRFLQEELGAFPAIRRTRTTIALGTVKEGLELPVPLPVPAPVEVERTESRESA